MASKLGEQSNDVYEQAVADRNTADSLRDQAADAAAERERLAALAETRADEARDAADAANAAVAVQEQKSTELYAQLASLKDTTAELERQRVEGQAREAAEAAAALPRQQLPPRQPQAAAAAAAGSPRHPAAAPAGGGRRRAGPGLRRPPRRTRAPSRRPSGSRASSSASRIDSAVPARTCGTARASRRCRTRRPASTSAPTRRRTSTTRSPARGLAVPLSQIQRGDLLFWGSGGDYYHVAIYLGGGRILEAPRDGVPVRNYFIWGSPSAAARPAG